MTDSCPQKITLPQFDNRFAQRLSEHFFTRLAPTPLNTPYLIDVNRTLAYALGFNDAQIGSKEFVDVFSGNIVAETSQPVAAVYSGHQFGVWAGQLGDGRAILLGELPLTDAAGIHKKNVELQLKGSGLTPYSRMGDGRAVQRSSIREFLCSEAMAGLQIPTSRAFSLIGSNDYVMREQPEKTAVVTRVAESFIRFGSFEHWYYNNQPEQLKQLADFVIEHYYAELAHTKNPYSALLEQIIKRTASLMAHWQAVGFMHGVMNTDNMSILGITLDYGPFGFMDAFDPQHICNHTDVRGRYAYYMQPRVGFWNCQALAQALYPLIDNLEEVQSHLALFQPHFESVYQELFRKKLGLESIDANDPALIAEFLKLMAENHVDFTICFRRLSEISKLNEKSDAAIRDLFIDINAIDRWLEEYRMRLQPETCDDASRKLKMNASNPKYILRNYLAQIAIQKAELQDFSEIHRLHHILRNPFDDQEEYNAYAEPPPDWAQTLEVSCSS